VRALRVCAAVICVEWGGGIEAGCGAAPLTVGVICFWQKAKLAAAAAKSEEDMASWKREGDAPWQKSDEGTVQGQTAL
jgi:hypothetical protein